MKKLVLDNEAVKNLTSRICRAIVGSRWHPDYVVGLTRGGLTPAVMISHWFDVPCETLKVALRDGGEPESNLWMAEDAFGYHRTDSPEPGSSNPALRKNILIVDDINDSGATFNWIMKDWPGGCLPNDDAWKDIWNNNVKFAVLVDNRASDCQRSMDYVGMEINKAEDDVWVDFPWEDWWAK
jgi:uncharacterized protein